MGLRPTHGDENPWGAPLWPSFGQGGASQVAPRPRPSQKMARTGHPRGVIFDGLPMGSRPTKANESRSETDDFRDSEERSNESQEPYSCKACRSRVR